MSATPIGVKPQATAAANQATGFGLRSTAQKAAIAPIKTRAFVGAAINQNTLETCCEQPTPISFVDRASDLLALA